MPLLVWPTIFKPILNTLVLLLSILHTGCTHVFYQPSTQKFFDPKDDGYTYQEVELKSTDGTRLMAWVFDPQKNAQLNTTTKAPVNATTKATTKATIVHFHGNGENISTFYRASAWLAQHGYRVLAFDYRGYGASEGTPSQEGLNQDGLAALNYAIELSSKDKNTAVIALGQSLGGAVLLRALQDVKDPNGHIKAVIIDSSFTNYKTVARQKLSSFFLTWPFQWLAYLLISNKYAPEEGLPTRAPIPLLVLHGTKDSVVDFKNGQELYSLALAPKEFWEIQNGTHIDAFFSARSPYRAQLLQWLDNVLKKRQPTKQREAKTLPTTSGVQ